VRPAGWALPLEIVEVKLDTERTQLNHVDARAAHVHQLVELQLAIVCELEREGEDATIAKRVLQNLESFLEAIIERRALMDANSSPACPYGSSARFRLASSN
jgi:hypothetical protein